MKKKILNIAIITILLCIVGCKDYLDIKPDKKLATLNTLKDIQSLLDESVSMNGNAAYAGEIACDDHYLTDQTLAALSSEYDRRIYNWEAEDLFAPSINSWFYIYQAIYVGNSTLENIANIDKTAMNALDWNNVKGEGYFYKGMALLEGAMIWAPAYDEKTAMVDLGMPLRESTDFNIIATRASVSETYNQIISDLKHAASLLPVTQISLTRPTKIAAFAVLSRAYLMMNKYSEAGLYADSALQLNSTLLDYNTFSKTATYTFPEFTVETLFSANMPTVSILNKSRLKVADALYQQYAADDLRKELFFKSNGDGTYAFKGSYSGGAAFAHAPAVDELYLNRAESYARQNKLAEALEDLNALLIKRWDRTKVYPKYESSNGTVVLNWILQERRKELVMRGLRWGDLKRLNKLGNNITITRNYNSAKQTLAPNSLRYVMSIPNEIIALSGMKQNP